jgi:hypothetical protein
MTGMMKTRVVPMGTRLAAPPHRRSTVEGMGETTVTCVMSFVAEMHATGLKTDVEIGSVTSRSSERRGTMTIMAPTTTNLIDSML